MSIGRWSDGSVTLLGSPFTLTATQGVAYLVASPDVTIPPSVTIDYSIFAKTSPTRGSATLAPGVFDGKLRVAFNAASSPLSRLQVLGTVAMPDAAGATVSYGFGTQSAFDNVATSGVQFDVRQPLDFYEPLSLTAGSATNSACPAGATCSVHFAGAIAGPNAARIGLAYNSRAIVGLTPAGETFEGAVIFGANGTFTPGTVPTPTPVPTPVPTLVGAPTGAALRYSRTGNFTRAVDVVADPDGKLTSLIGSYLRGTATDHENGGLASIIGWTRWSGGSPQGPGEGTAAIPINGGFGRIWGVPATAVPTAGTATYDLAGSTAVTAENGSLAPGKIQTASLAVDFGKGKVGFESTFSVGGVDYAIASRGGVAAPFMFLGVNNEFYGVQQAVSYVNVTGNGCRPDTCPASAAGFLAGPGASHAGISFNFYNPDAAGFAGAAIAFAKHP